MTKLIADYSFAHDEITPAALRKVPGCVGFVAYAGCYDERKNITRAEFQALINAGFLGALVIEDNTTDLIKGTSWANSQADRIIAAAKALGYDWQSCVCATGYDTDAHGGDYAQLLADMEAFARKVPHPGYYGDSDSIDYLHARHPEWFYWQSESKSFSPKNPTSNAHIWQQYDHPAARAAGLADSIDINVVRREPLGFMGEGADPMAGELSKTQLDQIAEAVWGHTEKQDGVPRRMDHALIFGSQHAYDALGKLDAIAVNVAGAVKALTDPQQGVLPRVAAAQAALAKLQTAVAAIKPAQVAVDVAQVAEGVATKVVAAVKAIKFEAVQQ